VEDAQTHASDMDSAAVRLIECTFMRDYYRLNSEYQKNEFKFEFLKQTSNFPTLFNIFCLHSSSDNWQRMITMHCLCLLEIAPVLLDCGSIFTVHLVYIVFSDVTILVFSFQFDFDSTFYKEFNVNSISIFSLGN